MEQTRSCAVCGTDISHRRSDARVCSRQQCSRAARKILPPRWTRAVTAQCTVVEDGVQCPKDAAHGNGAEKWCTMHRTRAYRHGDTTTVKVARRPHGEVQALLHQAAAVTGDECFLVPSPSGGRLTVSFQSRPMTAARAVWTIAKGDPGQGHVLHTCHQGDEGCISIRHLYLGDHEQNMIDMVAAERSTRGERTRHHKLTQEQVKEIRRRWELGRVSRQELAVVYGVSQTAISDVVTGRRWGWLAD